ncbi:MAG: ATP-binding protein [Candidatus Rokubacteria bacterium]|nr:ATP-binding protein [Candidatus Rokubacteria bacterium]
MDQLERVSESLQREVLEARMRPIGFLFERFARTVRDLGRELGKEVSLVARGHDIELDRVILDDISEPLLHLLRNAVSHGIEPAEARRRLGKPAEGTITLEASREADRIVLEVRDDGGGIDPERLREAAVRLGFADPERAQGLAPQELMALLFQPGFSTAREASDVSGRGVGLNVVKARVEGLRGSVEVSSAPPARGLASRSASRPRWPSWRLSWCGPAARPSPSPWWTWPR